MKTSILLAALVAFSPASALLAQHAVRMPDPSAGLTPFEKHALKRQAASFFVASEPAVATAAESVVSIVTPRGRVCFGTVVALPAKTKPGILTKWSEVKHIHSRLMVATSRGKLFHAKVSGVYPDHDLALLAYDQSEVDLKPLRLSKSLAPELGSFIVLAHPDGHVDEFGVVSVGTRSLRDEDKAYLGVIMDFNQGVRDGVSLKQVMPGSAADKGGLRKGDVIIALNESEISGTTEMRSQLQRMRPGSKLVITYVRGGAHRDTSVRLGSLAENLTIPRIPHERMEQMQRMGAIPSRVRSDFPSVIQTDMPIHPRDTGAPVTDLDGNVVGIAIARGSRIKSFIIPTPTISKILGSQALPPEKVVAMESRNQPPRNAHQQRSRPKPANIDEDPMDRVRRMLRGGGR